MTESRSTEEVLTPRAAARALGVDPTSLRFLSRRVNTHWRVADGRRRLVLRRYGHADDAVGSSALWEAEAVARIAACGLPVPQAIAGPVRLGDAIWALFPFLPGRHLGRSAVDEPRYLRLGGTLADIHRGTEAMICPPQRPGFQEAVFGALPRTGGERRREALLKVADDADAVLGHRLRCELEALEARNLPDVFAGAPRRIVHSDFVPWNLRFQGGRFSALLDFELAHVDVEAMDLASARRGYHDAVVTGYLSRRPLPTAQVAALDALWTASLFTWVWVMLEEAERKGFLETKAFSWHIEQFAKTRPFGGRASG